MSVSKLYLFAKNTDASAAMRGYQYQSFKTVETWLANYLQKVNEEIYCDYEEDIFQHNELTQAATFRQLKLYSSNFSFKSEEIKKALAHFFMLHVKTDYTAKNKEFVFEANSRVADARAGNEADLLREWVANQEELSNDLLARCIEQVKRIITEYVQERAAELRDELAKRLAKHGTDAAEVLAVRADEQALLEAQDVYEQLTTARWEDFVRSIKWRFEDLAPDIAFRDTITRLEQLVGLLPDMPKERRKGFLGMLCMQVNIKASEEKPENRKLVSRELDELMLQAGSLEDLWYHEVFTKWHEVGTPTDFRVGEFYEVLQAVSFCRQNARLGAHDAFWLEMLGWYIDELVEQPEFCKKALYELIWLRLRPTMSLTLPTGTFIGSEEYIREYFSDFSAFPNAADFEDVLSLLLLVHAAGKMGKSGVGKEESKAWLHGLEAHLEEKLTNTSNPSDACQLLECIFTIRLQIERKNRDEARIATIMEPLETLAAHLPSAQLYNVNQLSDRIHEFTRFLIKLSKDENELLIEALEEYTKSLNVVVVQRMGGHEAARKLVARGAEYLEDHKPASLLKTLQYFHEAKDLWLQGETFGGYALALLNIAQVYSATGMNLAAKYYALLAAWVCFQKEKDDRKLVKRIAQGFGLMFHADFQQGAWFSALTDFEQYIKAFHLFDTQPIDGDDSEIPLKTITDYAMLLYAAPLLIPEMRSLIDTKIVAAGYLTEDYIIPMHEQLATNLPSDKLPAVFARKLADTPLNDVGAERHIRFAALGLSWYIQFANNAQLAALGEEFCALLQILLVEVALSKVDFHLTQGSVKICAELTDSGRGPEQLPGDTAYSWKVFLQEIDSPNPEAVKMGIAGVTIALRQILSEISLLPAQEFEAAFVSLFEKNNLADKTLQFTSYQRMYRSLFSPTEYAEAERQALPPLSAMPGLPVKNEAMPWKNGQSAKYNKEVARRRISERYANAIRGLHLTLAKLKLDEGYEDWLHKLRQEGWLDWQITSAMLCFVVDYKTQRELAGQEFTSKEGHFQAMRETFHRYLNLDESECYCVFPLTAFQSPGFKKQLKMGVMSLLRSFGLENKSRFPNIEAIHTLLQVRFNLRKDNSIEDSPLPL